MVNNINLSNPPVQIFHHQGSVGMVDLVRAVKGICSDLFAEVQKLLKADVRKYYSVYEIALKHADSFRSFCTLPDGQLSNCLELERGRRLILDDISYEEDPNDLLKQIIDLRRQGMALLRTGKSGYELAQMKFSEATSLKNKVDEINSKLDARMKKKSTTFFRIPVAGVVHSGITLEDFIRPATDKDIRQNIFYHGTTIDKTTDLLRQEGRITFPPDFQESSSIRRHLDSGMGTYLALSQTEAQGYAENRSLKGVLTCKVDLSNLKIAYIKSQQILGELVHECGYFKQMAERYVKANEEEIDKDLKGRSGLVQNLVNITTKKYFQSLGYDGVFSPGSAKAGCAYLNIFEPNVNTVWIVKEGPS